MSDSINNGRKPDKKNDASLTELDFDSFLSDSPQQAEIEPDNSFNADIEETEKSLEADIRGLYEDIMSHTPSTDEPVLTPSKPEQPEEQPVAVAGDARLNPEEYYDEQPVQAEPFVPAQADKPDEVLPEQPEVAYNPAAPAEEDFNSVIAGALGELDSMLDNIYGDSLSKKPDSSAEMQDISSGSDDGGFEPSEAFNVVSPDELDFLTPGTAAKNAPPAASAQGDDYFLGRAPATAGSSSQLPSFSGGAVPEKIPSRKPAKEEKVKKTSAVFPAKGDSTGEIIRKIVLMVSLVTIVVSSSVLINSYFIEPYQFSVQADKAVDDLLVVDESGNAQEEDLSAVSAKNPTVVYPEGLQKKYYKLYAANDDLAGWINIPALQINLPLVQGKDNQYYLKRDVYGKRTKYGVPFFDYRNSMRVLNRNTVVYGHNMEYDDLIFGMLENYRTIEGFKSAPVIECNTIYDDYSWLVYACFVTNGEKKDDNGYVFNYNFTELDNFTFIEYKEQIDMRKLYTTGVDLISTDKILTLSTCCYDFDGARLVVVARLLRDGESLHVSTSNAAANPNPRYPQAWYDAQNKSNPYAGYEKWVAYADIKQ